MSSQALMNKAAPCGGRLIAYFIDGVLNCLPCYFCWKDGIRDGQSFGKGMMGLRVVKLQTGQPATIMDSCLRNCCNFCWPLLLVTAGRRHLGDMIAGTIVIQDQ